jgi:DNA-binding transcriptional MerR regulator
MLIGELAKQTGVSPRLLRYYEEQGLITTTRGANGYRTYQDEAPEEVRKIRALLSAGLSTEVIRDLLPCASGAQPTLEPCPNLLRTLENELAEIESRIESLSSTRDSLAGYLSATRRSD